MENIPKEIYLQIGEDVESEDFNELHTDAISWCQDKIFKNDIKYVLASTKDNEHYIMNALVQLLHRTYTEIGDQIIAGGISRDKIKELEAIDTVMKLAGFLFLRNKID